MVLTLPSSPTSFLLTPLQGPSALAQLICLVCELPNLPPAALPVPKAMTLHHGCKSQINSSPCSAREAQMWQSPLRRLSVHLPVVKC